MHIFIRFICDRAKSECHYNVARFKGMLEERDSMETAKTLLRAPTVYDGFVELFLRNRIDLTVEAQIIANPRFWSLFSETELDTARPCYRECRRW